jgi:hypothetical protein
MSLSILKQKLRPRTIKKVWVKNIDSKGGTKVWDECFVQMVLEMLLHCTPSSCIPPVILTVVESLYDDPTVNAVRQLPSILQTICDSTS